ncbi:TetR/AcrR family transcriptional regulator [Nocardia huaxiensis]|uniref:TetR/AcrR family transcriptional regulator n=1 Tax=Nocardia huaxiensis TaxID=2755382 RepID=A0A7D6VD10_9NOCA|nr:TetR/AcrR family transcriptional regulator [Nocardia huaxiensis]QLY33592.1 TetR/AcrR family transcriptional regulator [Nocardia huaxiensis]
MGFGKPGRPREDRLARQQEIFTAVRPLLLPGRTRELTMTQVAKHAHMSVGGLYHYFPSKRALVLFGMDPANLQRVCADFRREHATLAQTDPRALLTASLDTLAWAAIHYVQPSALAAVELDAGTFRAALEEVLTTELIGLMETVALAHPELTTAQAEELQLSLRRVCTLAFVDPAMTRSQLRDQLQATLDGTLLHSGGAADRRAS